MPGYGRAPFSAELKVVSSPAEAPAGEDRGCPADGSDLAREAGPETVLPTGELQEVLEAVRGTVEAALDTGARAVEIKVGAKRNAAWFGG